MPFPYNAIMNVRGPDGSGLDPKPSLGLGLRLGLNYRLFPDGLARETRAKPGTTALAIVAAQLTWSRVTVSPLCAGSVYFT